MPHLQPVPALLEEIDGLVDRDPVNPSVETRPALERAQCLVAFNERLLRQVVGVLVIGRHVVNRGVDAFLIAAHQFVVSRHVAGPGALDQRPFMLRFPGGGSGRRRRSGLFKDVGVHRND